MVFLGDESIASEAALHGVHSGKERPVPWEKDNHIQICDQD